MKCVPVKLFSVYEWKNEKREKNWYQSGSVLFNSLHVSECKLCLIISVFSYYRLCFLCFLSEISCRQTLITWHEILFFPPWFPVFANHQSVAMVSYEKLKTKGKHQGYPFAKLFMFFVNDYNILFWWLGLPFLHTYRHLWNLLKMWSDILLKMDLRF